MNTKPLWVLIEEARDIRRRLRLGFGDYSVGLDMEQLIADMILLDSLGDTTTGATDDTL